MSRSSAKTLLARQREQQGLELRLGGASYAQIAEKLQMTAGGAFKAVDRALLRQRHDTDEKAEKLRRIELARLDRLQLGLWPKAKRGEEKAVREVLRVMERRAKLLSLDAAARLEHTGTDGGPIEHEFDFSQLTDEQLAQAILDEAGRIHSAGQDEECGPEEQPV